MNGLFGAEIKSKYLDTVSDKDKNFVDFCLRNFSFSEEVHQTHLFNMTNNELLSTVHMSFIAPSNAPTARRIKTVLVNYWKWAKAEGLTNNEEPLKRMNAVRLCSDLAVAARYVKSYDVLYQLLEKERNECEVDTWLFIMLGMLLVYEGVPSELVGDIKYEAVDFEHREVEAGGQIINVREETLRLIQELHDKRDFVLRSSINPWIVGVESNEYIMPRLITGMRPLVGQQFIKFVSRYKQSKSDDRLIAEEWCTVDSVKLAGHFYRIYVGLEDNDLVEQIDYIYKMWAAAYYPIEH